MPPPFEPVIHTRGEDTSGKDEDSGGARDFERLGGQTYPEDFGGHTNRRI